MGRVIVKKIIKWNIVTESGAPKGRDKLFKELSPPDPMTLMNIWLRSTGIDIGAADSKGIFRAFAVGNYHGVLHREPLKIAQISDYDATVVTDYELFTGVQATDDYDHWLRLGNFRTDDARAMRLYAEEIEFEVENTGTAYDAGQVNAVPIGYIVTA